MVAIHVTPKWSDSHPVGTFALCDGRVDLPADRMISPEQAVEWTERDDPEFWRLCIGCRVSSPGHLKFHDTKEMRLAAQAADQKAAADRKAAAEAAALAEREGNRSAAKKRRADDLALISEAKLAHLRKMADIAGVKLKRRRPVKELPESARIDPAIADLAQRDAAQRKMIAGARHRSTMISDGKSLDSPTSRSHHGSNDRKSRT
jgi:hypothetical protein